jgi:hypothetical protein
MGVLDEEIGLVQNQAYGAALLAGFVHGYHAHHPEKAGTPLPYLFVALPMLLHSDLVELIASTRLGLRGFAEKCVSVEKAGTDLLLSINRRSAQYRGFTASCIAVLLSTGVAHLEVSTGRLLPHGTTALAGRPELPRAYDTATKLGAWFSALTSFEIASILKVLF